MWGITYIVKLPIHVSWSESILQHNEVKDFHCRVLRTTHLQCYDKCKAASGMMTTITLGQYLPAELQSWEKLSLCFCYARWVRTACLKALERSSILQCMKEMKTRLITLYICFKLKIIIETHAGKCETDAIMIHWSHYTEILCLYNQRMFVYYMLSLK